MKQVLYFVDNLRMAAEQRNYETASAFKDHIVNALTPIFAAYDAMKAAGDGERSDNESFTVDEDDAADLARALNAHRAAAQDWKRRAAWHNDFRQAETRRADAAAQQAEGYKAALEKIAADADTYGHKGDPYDCPECDGTNGGDIEEHGSIMAYARSASIAAAALTPESGEKEAGGG